MINKNKRQKTCSKLDLNFKDEERNTLLHHLFFNFSVNMESSVELCQELFKLEEQEGDQVVKLNDINKFGLSPLDVAVDQKQN